MNKLKDARDVLGAIWIISIVVRIISKVTNLYAMPKWSGDIIMGIIFTVAILSAYIYFKEKKK